MGVASDLISQALKLAGNTSIATADALNWLNNFLSQEYERKYPWQRATATISFASGAVSNTAAWPSTFLDTYEADDGSVGRYADSGGAINRLWEFSYRQYISRSDRNTSTGPPQRIVADRVGSTWYVYPKTDQAYTVTVDYYTKPAALASGGTPLWSTYAPDEILVHAIKCAALFHMDDTRYGGEMALLYGDPGRSMPGMLPTYRRRIQMQEGISYQSALDPQRFRPMPTGAED